MIRFASLGSGSKGNALLIESQRTRILLDCGFGPRTLAFRLGRLGLLPEDIQAVLVTHEHSDHVGGVFMLASRYRVPVFLTSGCLSLITRVHSDLPEICEIDGNAPFGFRGLEVSPFPVPHDAAEPVQYVLSDGASRLGVLTDTGHVTDRIFQAVTGCDALVLESNHDTHMLATGRYPAFLKARVGGNFGHLSNAAAADLLRAVDCSRLHHIIAAHLSEQNNTPELAQEALAAAAGCTADWIGVASQALGFDWREI